MSLERTYQFARRTNLLVLPAILMGLELTVFIAVSPFADTSEILASMSSARFMGTLALFSILPPYFLCMVTLQRLRTENSLAEMADLLEPASVARVHQRASGIRPASWFVVLLGAVFGAYQNIDTIRRVVDSGTVNAMDVTFVLANCFVWATIAFVLSWRLPISVALSQLGARMKVDVYRIDRLRPLARIATLDILVVAGAMAFMPLQSLDAEFRIVNYNYGIIVGVPAAIALFVLPLWGARGNIRDRKVERVAALQAKLEAVDHDDVAALEAVTAHIDRLRALSNWPVDLRLATRVFAYVIIPPLAWVGAALVENLVDRF
ncbi:MAG: hypothetical protein GWM88_07210 [Pseudomonadales bacterium]|nr:hypothetical protein [Pseudomonadales bacterium]NIX07804.1 hypothetical protein [Pseudomonadales bacterium]